MRSLQINVIFRQFTQILPLETVKWSSSQDDHLCLFFKSLPPGGDGAPQDTCDGNAFAEKHRSPVVAGQSLVKAAFYGWDHFGHIILDNGIANCQIAIWAFQFLMVAFLSPIKYSYWSGLRTVVHVKLKEPRNQNKDLKILYVSRISKAALEPNKM